MIIQMHNIFLLWSSSSLPAFLSWFQRPPNSITVDHCGSQFYYLLTVFYFEMTLYIHPAGALFRSIVLSFSKLVRDF